MEVCVGGRWVEDEALAAAEKEVEVVMEVMADKSAIKWISTIGSE